jgi:hypothetical protein
LQVFSGKKILKQKDEGKKTGSASGRAVVNGGGV